MNIVIALIIAAVLADLFFVAILWAATVLSGRECPEESTMSTGAKP